MVANRTARQPISPPVSVSVPPVPIANSICSRSRLAPQAYQVPGLHRFALSPACRCLPKDENGGVARVDIQLPEAFADSFDLRTRASDNLFFFPFQKANRIAAVKHITRYDAFVMLIKNISNSRLAIEYRYVPFQHWVRLSQTIGLALSLK